MVGFDIVGNIKIDEKNLQRIKHAIACIRSYDFLKKECKFFLNVEGASPEVYRLVKDALSGHEFQLTNYSEPNFGAIYSEMLDDSFENYIINFESDHFMLCDSYNELRVLLGHAKDRGVDIIRSSFLTVETKSSQPIIECIELHSGKETFIGERYLGKIFDMTPNVFEQFNHAYARYYIGTNCIFSRKFALKFWGRKFDSKSPHPWEIAQYAKDFEHRCMVPGFELQSSVEDDHGEPETCLLKRNEQKFADVLKLIKL